MSSLRELSKWCLRYARRSNKKNLRRGLAIVTAQLDVGRLRLLREVGLRGSIAAAARQVGITASAVSQQLAALEREAGVALLDRSPRGVQLTGAGQALAERARLIDALLEQAAAEIERQSGTAAGPLRLGAVTSAAGTVVSAAALRLATECPGLQLSVIVNEPAVSIAGLLAGDLDLALVDFYDGVPVALPDYLTSAELLVEPLLVLAPAGHFAAAPALSLGGLSEQRWVMPPQSAACGQAVRLACRAAGFEPDVRWETDDMYLLAAMVRAGHGIAVLPRLAVASLDGLELLPLSGPGLNRRLAVLARSSTAGRAVVGATLAALKQAARQLGNNH